MEYEPPYMDITEKECLADYKKLKGVKWNDLYVEGEWFPSEGPSYQYSLDLNGNVTMIGGLQSKLQGALSAGVTKVLIPFDNKKDLDEIIREKKIVEISDKKKDFNVLTVKNIFEMIPHVFVENDLEFVNYL